MTNDYRLSIPSSRRQRSGHLLNMGITVILVSVQNIVDVDLTIFRVNTSPREVRLSQTIQQGAPADMQVAEDRQRRRNRQFAIRQLGPLGLSIAFKRRLILSQD